MKLLRNFFRVLFVLWAGSLWAIAAFVTPTLFYAQPDRHLAGTLAARLFSIETYLALGLSLLVLATPSRSKYWLGWFATALLVVNEWLLKPVMEQARLHGHAFGLGFGPWHGVSALLYLIGCVCVLILVWRDALR
jgi:Domain of unknown function (DUF4149)